MKKGSVQGDSGESLFDSLVALCVAAIESIEQVAPIPVLLRRVKKGERINAMVRSEALEAISHYRAIESMLSRAARLDAQLPIVTASTSAAIVYRDRVGLLRSAIATLAAYDPDDVLWDIDLFLKKNRLPERVRSAICEALDYALNSDAPHFRINVQRFEDALAFAEEDMFQADSWIKNRAQLFPLLLNSETYPLRGEFRRLIREVYLAFTFGLWASCTALCRATVEFRVRQSCRRRGIRLTDDRNGKREERTLANLANDLLTDDKHLLEMVHCARRLGNDVLHVGDDMAEIDEIDYERRCRIAAEDAIRLMRKIVEGLHSFDSRSRRAPKASG